MSAVLYFVIPCFNESEVLPLTVPVFLQKLSTLASQKKISADSRILLVNDASNDSTWEVIKELHKKDKRVTGIDLAKNIGEQRALLAGLFTVEEKADCVITMDCDLQDDIDAVDSMVDKFLEGNDLVLGVRSSRDQAGFSEKFFSAGFYKLASLLHTGVIKEHANYRLMSKRSIGMLREQISMPFYFPAIAATMGLPTATVTHKRLSRAAGKSGYTLKRRFRLAFDTIFAHSTFPLTLLTLCPVVCSVLTLICVIAFVLLSIRARGFRTDLCILSSIWFLGTIVSCAVRVLGEYIYMIYTNLQNKPIYQIRDEV
ncbi:MAG: glycosyltransferase family 2 protein [Oscillospiraceae bacterium]|nr:glycosyltransferase family 2 protein [Oscillospiraceae bacterium]